MLSGGNGQQSVPVIDILIGGAGNGILWFGEDGNDTADKVAPER